jgi:hypothetical protein
MIQRIFDTEAEWRTTERHGVGGSPTGRAPPTPWRSVVLHSVSVLKKTAANTDVGWREPPNPAKLREAGEAPGMSLFTRLPREQRPRLGGVRKGSEVQLRIATTADEQEQPIRRVAPVQIRISPWVSRVSGIPRHTAAASCLPYRQIINALVHRRGYPDHHLFMQ